MFKLNLKKPVDTSSFIQEVEDLTERMRVHAQDQYSRANTLENKAATLHAQARIAEDDAARALRIVTRLEEFTA